MLEEEKVKRAIIWKLPDKAKDNKQHLAFIQMPNSWVECLCQEHA